MPIDREKTKAGMQGYGSYEVWARKNAGGSDAYRDLWDEAQPRKRGRPRKQPVETPPENEAEAPAVEGADAEA